MAAIIDLINSNISKKINKEGEVYKALIGDTFFTPASPITDSGDYACGAVANEIEYARLQTTNLVNSFHIADAEDEMLEFLVMALINLPRRGSSESDTVYRQRFNCVVRQGTNTTRCTGGAMHDAIIELGLTDSQFHFFEKFDDISRFFQLRLVGVPVVGAAVMFIDSMKTGFLDQYFMGGLGIGSLQTYITPLIKKIKALGVRFEIKIVSSDTETRTSDATITA